MNMQGAVKDAENVVAKWGFPPPYTKLHEGLSPKVAEIIHQYYLDFPNVEKHLYLTGNSYKAVKTVSTLVRDLLITGGITRRVNFLPCASFLELPSWDLPEIESKIETADITVLHEIGQAKLNSTQSLHLYNLINSRIYNTSKYRFIFISGNHPDEVALNTSKSLIDTLEGTAYVLGVG